ncbi:endopeptidase (CLP homologue) ATP-binding chain, putative [Theileria annulata]|uniref:Endopeptidase (CLP homologue) ATP-binding chain, putative n=1 Tax=Theileria annulata TaxID=5874 RepID=Q4U8P5_THEAN|nr:endopeptidase (CLP homologue) ATP-binding chain, putative [Theileria annulata]CAI76808.1 endopeptidase (CLP homologue) ATP-binding chain, putative [Theileria annulata]|eukprot:XP_953433.1 endopeptidase (CLP homologue) ATP-binding chain, putative [Theileria annulata]
MNIRRIHIYLFVILQAYNSLIFKHFNCFKYEKIRNTFVINNFTSNKLISQIANVESLLPTSHNIAPLYLNFDNFSDNAIKVLMLSLEEAKLSNQPSVESAHIFQGLVCLNQGLAFKILKEFGVTVNSARNAAKSSYPVDESKKVKNLPTFSNSAKNALDYSSTEAERLGNSTIETEHLLLGVLNDTTKEMSTFYKNLDLDVTLAIDTTVRTIEKIKEIKESNSLSENIQESSPNFVYLSPTMNRDELAQSCISLFTVDLTEKARNGQLPKVIHRDNEIERAIITLSRMTKSNPLLVGEPGVGKTAIVEGIANKISQGISQPQISKKRILQLQFGLLIAGTKFRGQFEERLTKLIDEIKSSGDIILVIDEAHMLIGMKFIYNNNKLGAGAGDGSIDAANLLKPPLSRGEIQCIAITTPKEYKKYFEKDMALSRRFHPIYVDEPSEEDTLKILNGISSSYGEFHGVEYTQESIKLALKYSKQYINDRFLPDKAIDIMDESGSFAKIQYQNELKREKNELTSATETEGNGETESNPENEVEQVVEKKEQNVLGQVKPEHVAEVMSIWTGIPLKKLTRGEMEIIRNMEEDLHKMVIGQEEAVKNVCKAIRRAKTNIKNPNRPIGSFLFCGPPGVGKSEVARALTKYLFAKENLIRIDMSEYTEPHSISRILGSPPGYKGHDTGGQLTEKVKSNPYSVVMFDEIEKAHHDVLNILLQILEDGKLTDSKNQTISFKNTIIIMTSNTGSNVIQRSSKGVHTFGFTVDSDESSDYLKIKALVMEELKSHFLPELINRIDDVILFKPLSESELKEIAKLMLNDLTARANSAGILIEISEKFADYILKLPRDDKSGARPLRRLITSVLEDKLADLVISDDFDSNNTYTVTVDEADSVVINPKVENETVVEEVVLNNKMESEKSREE